MSKFPKNIHPTQRVIRENTDAHYPWLIWQVGYMETRISRVPVYLDRQILRFKNDADVKVFRLVGFGETLERAEKMAGLR